MAEASREVMALSQFCNMGEESLKRVVREKRVKHLKWDPTSYEDLANVRQLVTNLQKRNHSLLSKEDFWSIFEPAFLWYQLSASRRSFSRRNWDLHDERYIFRNTSALVSCAVGRFPNYEGITTKSLRDYHTLSAIATEAPNSVIKYMKKKASDSWIGHNFNNKLTCVSLLLSRLVRQPHNQEQLAIIVKSILPVTVIKACFTNLPSLFLVELGEPSDGEEEDAREAGVSLEIEEEAETFDPEVPGPSKVPPKNQKPVKFTVKLPDIKLPPPPPLKRRKEN